ncbi:MAG: hypothetical protein GC206_13400 [Alphaproteobacteria bacterium]|nr:hypothetical protein [Alphaproteobacteria bacterium]
MDLLERALLVKAHRAALCEAKEYRSSPANRRVRNRRRQAAFDDARRVRNGESLADTFERSQGRRPRAVAAGAAPPRKRRRMTASAAPRLDRVTREGAVHNRGDNAVAEHRRQSAMLRTLEGEDQRNARYRRMRRRRRLTANQERRLSTPREVRDLVGDGIAPGQYARGRFSFTGRTMRKPSFTAADRERLNRYIDPQTGFARRGTIEGDTRRRRRTSRTKT